MASIQTRLPPMVISRSGAFAGGRVSLKPRRMVEARLVDAKDFRRPPRDVSRVTFFRSYDREHLLE